MQFEKLTIMREVGAEGKIFHQILEMQGRTGGGGDKLTTMLQIFKFNDKNLCCFQATDIVHQIWTNNTRRRQKWQLKEPNLSHTARYATKMTIREHLLKKRMFSFGHCPNYPPPPPPLLSGNFYIFFGRHI